MNRKLKMVLGLIATLWIGLVAQEFLSMAERLHTYNLSLTVEGCAYARSINLPVRMPGGQCSVAVRFYPCLFNGGGVIHFDDDREISVTDAMLLAKARADTDLPYTPAQQSDVRWFRVWMGMAIFVGSANVIYWVATGMLKRGQKKT